MITIQTFLPYQDFAAAAAVLDRQRIGKQRVETLQIMKALVTGQGWINHPATKMWRGYEGTLLEYQDAICHEWVVVRGYKDTCRDKTWDLVADHMPNTIFDPQWQPAWLGNEDFHAAHRSNLLRKNPEWYGQFGWTEPDNLEYVWPIK